MVGSFKTVLSGIEDKTVFTRKMRENVELFEGDANAGWPASIKIKVPSSTLLWFKNSYLSSFKRLLANPETALEMALALDELNIYKDSLEITYPNEEEEGANTDEGTL